MNARTWKVLAIVFMIVSVLFAAFMVTTFIIGSRMIANEEYCWQDCSGNGGSVFYWDDSTGYCECSSSNGSIIYHKRL